MHLISISSYQFRHTHGANSIKQMHDKKSELSYENRINAEVTAMDILIARHG